MNSISIPTLVLLALAGALGAMLRYLIDVAITMRQERRADFHNPTHSRARTRIFPWGILAANTLACFVMAATAGYAARIGVNPWNSDAPGAIAILAITVGFCGSLSTMSTFIVSIVSMLRAGVRTMALAYLTASLAAGLLAAGMGLLVAKALEVGFPTSRILS